MPVGSYRIVDYDPQWPVRAAQERLLVARTLALPADRVEHVGSTAVPGLGAKPIIDLMVGLEVEPVTPDGEPARTLLQSIGYVINGTETAPGTLYCRKAEPRRFNLHATRFGKVFWSDHLRFRDWLRTHPEDAADYERLKREILAGMSDSPSQPAYNAAKASLIAEILARARKG